MKPFTIDWAKLGWGAPPPQGSIGILVIAPWCPDCQEYGPRAIEDAPQDRTLILAGEYAPRPEVEHFAAEHGLQNWQIASGTQEKSPQARDQAGFNQIRLAFQDQRTWGVPLWILGHFDSSKQTLAIEKIWDPSLGPAHSAAPRA